MKNLVLVNFKSYKEGSFDRALKLAKICDDLSKKFQKEIMIAVEAADIFNISRHVKIKVLAQHIDPVYANRSTGFIEATDIKKNGAYGTILNHSEHKLKYNDLKKSVGLARKAKLKNLFQTA